MADNFMPGLSAVGAGPLGVLQTLDRRLLARTAMAVVIVGALTACSSAPRWANPTAWFTDEAPQPKKAAESDGKDFPKLGETPDRPKSQLTAQDREKLAESLAADRSNAKYTDEELRAESIDTARVEPTPPPPAPAPVTTASPVEVATNSPAAVPAPPPIPSAHTNNNAETIYADSRPSPTLEVSSAGARPYQSETNGAIAATPAIALNTFPAPEAKAAIDLSFAQPYGGYTVVIDSHGIVGEGGGYLGGRSVQLASYQGGAVMNDASVPYAPVGHYGKPSAVIKFPGGGSNLSSRDREILKKIAQAVQKRGGNVRVVGHTSQRLNRNVSVADYRKVNQQISQSRADAVSRQLQRFGVDFAQIVVEARGADQPLYYEVMPAGEAENRRVEIFLE